MPVTVTAIGTNTSTSGASVAVTVGAAGVPSGSLIVVVVTEKSTSGTSGTLADTQTNTWNASQAGNVGGSATNGRGMVFFAFNSKALVNTNTITYTKNLSGANAAITAFYISGARTAVNPEDTAARANTNGTTGTITVTSGTPNTQEDIFVGALCDSGSTAAGAAATFTQATSWLPAGGFEANSGTAAAGNARVDAGYRVQVGAKATFVYNPTLSSTAQQWILFVTAFTIAQEPAAYDEDVLKQFKTMQVISYRCG